MTTPKAKLAGLALIAALCGGFTLGLTTPAWAGWNEVAAAYLSGDYATASRELRPLAEQGDAGAQYKLGVMYDKGRGVPQDYAKAVQWYRKAAEQGDAGAQYIFGLYKIGEGVPLDYAEVVKWSRKAAEQGVAEAQYNLGVDYKFGQGVPQDYAQAHMWFNLAASRHPPGEDRNRAARNRDTISILMTPAKISEAQKLAQEWRPK